MTITFRKFNKINKLTIEIIMYDRNRMLRRLHSPRACSMYVMITTFAYVTSKCIAIYDCSTRSKK